MRGSSAQEGRQEVFSSIDALEDEWDALADDAGAAPFLRPGWFRAWRGSFGTGRLRVFALHREGRLAAVLPLELRRGALHSPANPHTPFFELLAADAEAARTLAGRVLAAGARSLTLEMVPAGGTAFEAFRTEAAGGGHRTAVAPATRSPYIRCGDTLASHERSLSRNLRHDVQRRFRRLYDGRAVAVQVADGRRDMDDLLSEGLAVERAGWKGAEGTAIASQAATRRFYRELARWAARNGSLRLAFLRVDGRPIAFQFDLEDAPAYYSLKIGYDPEYARFAPGKLLAYTMLARAASRGFRTYELLGTDEPWKERWTDRSREYVSFRAFAPSAAGRASWSAFAHGRPLARRLPLARRVASFIRR